MKNTPQTEVKNTPFLATKSTRIFMGLVVALLTIAGAGSARPASISWDFNVVPLDGTADQGVVMAYGGDGQTGISAAFSPSNLSFAHDKEHVNVVFPSPTFENPTV